ncbi:MAG: PHP domain-containing protein [Thermodesulfobacteriota bacterium]|nr:PHP domain-containing protein [Thermodesulfobacteriota bacterium]
MIPKMDLHIHTIFSDGKCTMQEVVKIAEERGLEYIAFTDHAFSNNIFTIDENTIEEYIHEANRIKEKSTIKILTGLEAEIPTIDKVMKYRDQLDLLLISNHGPVRGTFRDAITNLIKDHTIDIIAHPWYINDTDWDEIINAALERDVAIELNSFRKVPEKNIVERIAKGGVKLSISSDAHFKREIGMVQWAYDILDELDLGKESLIKLT